MKNLLFLWRSASSYRLGVSLTVALLTMMPADTRAGDWDLAAPATAYAVQGSAVRINGIQFTGDPNAGNPSTGPTQMQLTLSAGVGTVLLDCSSSIAVKTLNLEWFSPGNITATGTPEEIAQSFLSGLIYIAPDTAPPVDVLILNAVSSRGGTASAMITVETRATHLEAWQSTYFTPADLADPTKEPTLWGPGAMLAGDGVPNLVKFSFNRGPYEAVQDMMPKPGLTNGGHTFIADVLCRTDVPGLTNVAEWSVDLLQWQSGPAYLDTTSVTPITADLASTHVQAVSNTSTQQQGFIRVLGTPPVIPPPPSPPPFTPALLAQIQSQLSGLQLVPGDPLQATPSQLAAARDELRQSYGVVYGELTQTMDLPPGCTNITTITTTGNGGSQLASAGPVKLGEVATANQTGIDGQPLSLSWELVPQNGHNQLVFTSPYNNRFKFHINYLDASGQSQSLDIQCSGSVDERGFFTSEDDCTRPYFGWPRIFISGFAQARFDAGGMNYMDFLNLIRGAVAGMGGVQSTAVAGVTTEERDGGAEFIYALDNEQKMDICRSALMARLQIIADQMGATLTRNGDIITLTGPDAGGLRPNRWAGPYAH